MQNENLKEHKKKSEKKTLEKHIAELETILTDIETDEDTDIETLTEKIDNAMKIIEICEEKISKIDIKITHIKQKLTNNSEENDE